MPKWKCDICGTEFDNFQAQGFDNKIYCPLCFYKHEFNTLNKGIDELLIKYEEEFKILGQDGFGYDFERYGKWLVTENVIQDLKKLKGE